MTVERAMAHAVEAVGEASPSEGALDLEGIRERVKRHAHPLNHKGSAIHDRELLLAEVDRLRALRSQEGNGEQSVTCCAEKSGIVREQSVAVQAPETPAVSPAPQSPERIEAAAPGEPSEASVEDEYARQCREHAHHFSLAGEVLRLEYESRSRNGEAPSRGWLAAADYLESGAAEFTAAAAPSEPAGRCSQCGQRFDERACGPTHAMIAAERAAALSPHAARAARWADLDRAVHLQRVCADHAESCLHLPCCRFRPVAPASNVCKCGMLEYRHAAAAPSSKAQPTEDA